MSDLQFERAEFDTGSAKPCVICKDGLTGEYYSVNGHMICPRCREQLGSAQKPVTLKKVVLALVLGSGAAILGGALWGFVTYSSNSQWGLIAVVVGLGVGYAVAKGSDRTGGWVFQGIAIALTYLAIAGSWIPSLAHEAHIGNGEQGPLYWAVIALLALEMPVRYGLSSILGALINLFALYEAWKTNKRPVIRINGPFPVRPATTPPEAVPGG